MVVDEVNRRPPSDIPKAGNLPSGSQISAPETAPVDRLLFETSMELVEVSITIHSYQGEWSCCHFLHERPLVGVHRPAGSSPVTPEIEENDFSSIIGQLELFPKEIDTDDVWRLHANL